MSQSHSVPLASGKSASRPFLTLRGRDANSISATARHEE